MPYVDAGGVKLYVEETGQGRPIIFAHEFGSDLRSWDPQIRHFAKSHRCIVYNARGYPPSDVPEDAALYGWEHAVGDIDAVMRGLGLDRAHLVGASMGAYAALQFGLRYPGRASAIVAAAAGSGCCPSQREQWLKQTSTLARSFIDRGLDVTADRIAHSPTRIQLKHKNPTAWRAFADRLGRLSVQGLSTTMVRYQMSRPSLYDSRDSLATLAIPVLLAVGDEDRPCLDTNLMLKADLPDAGLWICPNTGHTINLEEPAAFNAQVEGFFDAVERGSWRRGYSLSVERSRGPDVKHAGPSVPVAQRR
ncbi:alpha/beta hydrolase [Bradyrhizobium sp. SZCCHNR1015]|uniref:alpha/beta fold hydrolase n=1 Tax=Bradyrhizobium sp. SZCCHNR1015 TaxID=3057338 RepID=UPI002916368A|nr:alpha/beta hydrolase [Bradyrhizobium sp. SZCCHNR1015]